MANENEDSSSELYSSDESDNINVIINLPTDVKLKNPTADGTATKMSGAPNLNKISARPDKLARTRKPILGCRGNYNIDNGSATSAISLSPYNGRPVVHTTNCKYYVRDRQNKSNDEEMNKERPDTQTAPSQPCYTDLVFDFDVPNILEMSDFCPCLITVNVYDMFEKYADNKLQITWVDDGHLLLIFPTVSQAALALETMFSTCKLRPLKDACPLSKYIAKRNGLVLRNIHLGRRIYGNIAP